MFGTEPAYFVGRTKELEILHKHVRGGLSWRWLHLYGQGGIGKSTLLRRFRSEAEDCSCYYIDGSKAIEQKEAFLEQLASQLPDDGDAGQPKSGDSEAVARRINRQSRLISSPIVLIIDAFEHWHETRHWFLQWFGLLEPQIRLVSAGRNALTGSWLRSDWAEAIHAMQLQALTAPEVVRYAGRRGISDPAAKTRLFQFSRGVPLAMVLAAETMRGGVKSKRFEREESYQLLSVLIQEVLRGLPASVHRIVEAASVYWRFNEERLSAVLENELDPETFRRFVSMPFIMMNDDGWMLHDAVRAWVLEDFTLRKPNGYEVMRRNALQQIRKEERLHPQRRSRLQFEKMSLHEHPIVRAICFSGHPDEEFELRDCRKSDLHALRELYIRSHRYLSSDPDDDPLLLNHLESIWETDPASFVTIWKQNELIAFFCKIPMRGLMLKVLRHEPLLHPFLNGWQPVPGAYLFGLLGFVPELEDSARSYVINTLIHHFSRSEWIATLHCQKEWFPVFELCGFERGAWADTLSAKGTEYRAFILDLRQEDFLAKLDRSVSRQTIAQASAAPTIKPDIQELKNIVKQLTVLPRKPALYQAYARLFPGRTKEGLSDEAAGHAARKELEAAIRRMAEGDETVEPYGRLLTLLYVEKIRPHERVAKRLNVSSATYYRYLNKALELLYQSLESEGDH